MEGQNLISGIHKKKNSIYIVTLHNRRYTLKIIYLQWDVYLV